jgi:hypothetical protein
MLARVVRSPFARYFGLLLLVLAILLVVFAPTSGWAEGQGAGTALGVVPPAAIAVGSHAMDDSQGALIESGRMEPGTVQGLDIAGQPFLSPLVIPAADFRNDGFSPNSYFFPFGGGYIQSQGSTACMMAPAYLPQGATATQMSVSIYDNGGTTRPSLYLYRVDNFGGTVVTMGSVATTATSTSIRVISDASILFPSVSYPTYSYYVAGCLYSVDQHLYSVRLYYSGP